MKFSFLFLIFILTFNVSSVLFCEEIAENVADAEDVKTEALEEDLKTREFSLDFDYLSIGLENGGFGLGFSFEQYLIYHFAIKANFGHSVLRFDDNFVPTVSFGGFAEFYPLSKSLDKLYLAFGSYMDFIGYSDLLLSENVKRNFISIYPLIGYKWKINRFIATEFKIGFKHIFMSENDLTYDNYKDYVKDGIKWNIGVKINFKEIISALRKRHCD